MRLAYPAASFAHAATSAPHPTSSYRPAPDHPSRDALIQSRHDVASDAGSDDTATRRRLTSLPPSSSRPEIGINVVL
ncbi:hypothetical protein C8J57DRAFT_1517742 [Mycena rebaudengoi]|nr:hypothetical protein C8J57DRAFT_1517742 [Mycena rebaudengoi]